MVRWALIHAEGENSGLLNPMPADNPIPYITFILVELPDSSRRQGTFTETCAEREPSPEAFTAATR